MHFMRTVTANVIERLNDNEIISEVIEIAMEPTTTDVSSDEISDYIRIIRLEQDDKSIIRELIAKQKQAEMNRNYLEAAKIGMEIMRIQKELKEK